MRKLTGLLAFLLLVLPQSSSAQVRYFADEPTYVMAGSLEIDDRFDAVQVGGLICVYRYSDLPRDKAVVTELSRIIPVDRAAVHGKPGKDVQALLDEIVGPVECELQSATVLSWGDQGFFWVVDFELYPRFGGLGGAPWQYRALVNPDGSLIQPERHLCDYLQLWKLKNGLSHAELRVFSHIAFDDFASPVDEKLQLHGDQILERATAAVSAFMEKERPQGSRAIVR